MQDRLGDFYGDLKRKLSLHSFG